MAWKQASLGYDKGGIAWKSVHDLALPAFVASRTAPRPAARFLFEGLEKAGFGSAAEVLEAFDERSEAAVARLRQRLPADLANRLADVVAAGGQCAEQRWQQQVGPESPEVVVESTTETVGNVTLQDALTACGDTAGKPGAQGSARLGGQLQRAICAVCDEARLEAHLGQLQSAGRAADLRRMSELTASDDQERGWLWAIRHGSEPTLEPADFALAGRTMIGADILVQPMLWWLWETYFGCASATRPLLHGVSHNRGTQPHSRCHRYGSCIIRPWHGRGA